MQPTAIAKAGIVLPQVLFGTSNLGNLFVALSDEEKLAVCRSWFRHAPKPVVIDTAGKYGAGLALESIGRCLRTLAVAPEDVVISNKLGWARRPLVGSEPTFEPGAWVGLSHDAEQKISYDGVLACWEEGNRLLGDPYRAALLSVHDPDEYLAAAESPRDRADRLENVVGAYRALRELQQRGEARAVGVGAKDWRVIAELDALVALDWVMIANSLTVYRHEPALLAFLSSLAERGVTVINSAVFHSGFLLGGDNYDYRRIDGANAEDRRLLAWRASFLATCSEHNVEPVDACVRFATSPPAIAAIAVNSSRPQRVGQLVAAVHAEVPGEFWDALRDRRLIDPSYAFV